MTVAEPRREQVRLADLDKRRPVVAQAWRHGARRTRLARLLPMIDARTVDIGVAKTAGELLATSKTSDVVDALLALLAPPGDQILTSDPGDLKTLLRARKVPATLVMV